MSSDNAVVRWLLDSDPSIRWQVLRDLLDAPPELVNAERSRIAAEGWGAHLLGQQTEDGHWGGSTESEHHEADLFTLQLLREFGVDQSDERMRNAIARTRDRVTWGAEFGDSPFFEGETEPCINGLVLAIGAYFGVASESLVGRLLGEQLDDGGWNCEAPPSIRSSFDTTICVLEGLAEYERTTGAAPDVTAARKRAETYLLERGLMRSLSTGDIITHRWGRFHFPTRTRYDVLRALDYFRATDAAPEPRLRDAIDLVRERRHGNGRWPQSAPNSTWVPIAMDNGRGTPSRWITLRAMRVLRWADAGRTGPLQPSLRPK